VPAAAAAAAGGGRGGEGAVPRALAKRLLLAPAHALHVHCAAPALLHSRQRLQGRHQDGLLHVADSCSASRVPDRPGSQADSNAQCAAAVGDKSAIQGATAMLTRDRGF
jgi:hypothetical protein